jgi:hypothetical protein
MAGALEGVSRALKHMIRIENELALKESTEVRVVCQFIPYFMIAVVGTAACAITSIRFKP